jgi:hypothetical protein
LEKVSRAWLKSFVASPLDQGERIKVRVLPPWFPKSNLALILSFGRRGDQTCAIQ